METYKMTDEDIALMIHLRATNDAIFTGKRNSALMAWTEISKEMGLHGTVTPVKLKKKWENLKEKYKLLKNPPAGMEQWSQSSSWRWYQLMDQAMTGRPAAEGLVCSGPLLVKGEEPHCRGGASSRRDTPSGRGAEESGEEKAEVLQNWHTALLYSPVVSDGQNRPIKDQQGAPENIVSMETVELDKQNEVQLMESEQGEFDRERFILDRERELLKREMVTVERARVALEKDKAAVDRERAVLDRERAVLDRERAVLDRERAVLDRERVVLDRERAVLDRDPNNLLRAKEHPELDRLSCSIWTDAEMETRDKLFSLWERFIDKL